MLVLSHRGCWNSFSEKNARCAFERSFALGYGTETDVRDAVGELLIAHDPPSGNELSLTRFLELYRQSDRRLPIALNIKADGLAQQLAELLVPQDDCFLFDMSTPDMLDYLGRGLAVFSRQSELERDVVCYDRVRGVWMDCFFDDWFGEREIAAHLDAGKRVCLVSPELHGRDPRPLWDRLSTMSVKAHANLMLCTDHPESASAVLI